MFIEMDLSFNLVVGWKMRRTAVLLYIQGGYGGILETGNKVCSNIEESQMFQEWEESISRASKLY